VELWGPRAGDPTRELQVVVALKPSDPHVGSEAGVVTFFDGVAFPFVEGDVLSSDAQGLRAQLGDAPDPDQPADALIATSVPAGILTRPTLASWATYTPNTHADGTGTLKLVRVSLDISVFFATGAEVTTITVDGVAPDMNQTQIPSVAYDNVIYKRNVLSLEYKFDRPEHDVSYVSAADAPLAIVTHAH
jgi:hypothetical protein